MECCTEVFIECSIEGFIECSIECTTGMSTCEWLSSKSVLIATVTITAYTAHSSRGTMLMGMHSVSGGSGSGGGSSSGGGGSSGGGSRSSGGGGGSSGFGSGNMVIVPMLLSPPPPLHMVRMRMMRMPGMRSCIGFGCLAINQGPDRRGQTGEPKPGDAVHTRHSAADRGHESGGAVNTLDNPLAEIRNDATQNHEPGRVS